jgi:NADPH-dependent 2,4-dienoyl-CoA reductase/sulfur reductase-like enzyme
MIGCTVNPLAGREKTWGPMESVTSRRHVLIVGGGPAGMQVAATAAERGHSVTLLERSRQLGGQVRYAAALPNRAAWNNLVEDLALRLERFGVDVQLGVEATRAIIDGHAADQVVFATGSTWETTGRSFLAPARGPVTRHAGARVVTPIEAIAEREQNGDSIVIIDDSGEYLALGLAELLAEPGKLVEIVTARASVGDKLGLTGDMPFILPRLLAANVRLSAAAVVEEIGPGSVTVTDTHLSARRVIPADTVVMLLGRKSNDSLFHELAGRREGLARVGDCVAPRDVDDAIYEGMALGRTL